MSGAETQRLDDAARAGWLYYVARRTQDDIARELGISRQKAQRLVALAATAGLVKVRLEHPIARCMELGERMRDRWGLGVVAVCPTDPAAPALLTGVAAAAGAEMERVLADPAPRIVALGTGRALTASVDHVARMAAPQHRIVSLLGNMMADGSASPYGATVRLAERIGAPHYPMALPVLAADAAEVATLQAQRPAAYTLDLCAQADAVFVGVGTVGHDSPLVVDGFVPDREMDALLALGAVGEITGRVYDGSGSLIRDRLDARVTGAPVRADPPRPVIGVANGPAKAASIAAALRGRLLNGLVTDEATAVALLGDLHRPQRGC